MKKILIVLTLGALVVFGYFFFTQKETSNITNYDSSSIPSSPNIVMIGDSLVAGYGAQEGNSLSTQLGALVGQSILNLGVSGNTTGDVFARIDKVPADTYLTIVIAGGNDVLRRVSEEETIVNMRAIIAHLQGEGSIVAIASVKSSFFGEGSLTQKYEDLAKEKGVIYLGSILSDVYDDDSLMSDNIHPNDMGYAIIAKHIATGIESYTRK